MSTVTMAPADAGAGSEAGTGNDGAVQSADVVELARALGHQFADLSLLRDAVTHPSLMGLERAGRKSHKGPGIAYERLEFLGDRVVGLVVAQWLLERYPNEREGALAKRHAALVRRESLGRVADTIGLGAYLRLSPAEASSGGREPPIRFRASSGTRSLESAAAKKPPGALRSGRAAPPAEGPRDENVALPSSRGSSARVPCRASETSAATATSAGVVAGIVTLSPGTTCAPSRSGAPIGAPSSASTSQASKEEASPPSTSV